MTKQQRINTFILEFGKFLEKYYTSQITDISYKEKEDWLIATIKGKENSTIELWTEGGEVIVIFGESHWHIDDYNDPIDYENIYENTIDSVFQILQGEIGTYSCWKNGSSIGGASFTDSTDEEILDAVKGNDHFKTSSEIKIKTWCSLLRTIEL